MTESKRGSMRLRLILSAAVAAVITYVVLVRDMRRAPRRHDTGLGDRADRHDAAADQQSAGVFLAPFVEPGDLTPPGRATIDDDPSLTGTPRVPALRFTGRDRTDPSAATVEPVPMTADHGDSDDGEEHIPTASPDETVHEVADSTIDADDPAVRPEVGRTRLTFARPDDMTPTGPDVLGTVTPLISRKGTAEAPAATVPIGDPAEAIGRWAWGASEVGVGEIDLPDVASRSGSLAELRRLTPFHGAPRVNLAYAHLTEVAESQDDPPITIARTETEAAPVPDGPVPETSVVRRARRTDVPLRPVPVPEPQTATEILATGDFSVAGVAQAPGEGTITAVTFPRTLPVSVSAEAVELASLDLVNVAPQGVVVMDDEGFRPNPDGFVLLILSAEAGAFSARGTYRVTE